MSSFFSHLFCSHYWQEIPDDAKVAAKDTGVMLNFKDVQCRKCHKQKRMTRQQYVQHLIETDRFNP